MLFGETFAGCKRVNSCRNGTPKKLLAQYRFGSTGPAGRILIHPPSLKWPLSLRGTSGERAGERGSSIELSGSFEIPSPSPSPHFSACLPRYFVLWPVRRLTGGRRQVVGRGNRPRAWGWYQDAPASDRPGHPGLIW